MSLRKLLPLVNGLLLLVAIAVFIPNHGGLKGDSHLNWSDDAVSEPQQIGPILFNRWRIDIQKESLLVRGFVWINIAAFSVSALVPKAIANISDQFYTMYPYGISYATYNVLLGLMLAFIQWYGVGVLIEVLRKKHRSITDRNTKGGIRNFGNSSTTMKCLLL